MKFNFKLISNILITLIIILYLLWFGSLVLMTIYPSLDNESTEKFQIIIAFTWLFLIFLGNAINNYSAKFNPIAIYKLKQQTYEDFQSYLNKRAKECDYELKVKTINAIFYRKIIKKRAYYIIDIRVDELSENLFNEIYNNEIKPIINEELKEGEQRGTQLYISFIISVNRITSYLNTFIKKSMEDLFYSRLGIGVSFGGKKIYVVDEKLSATVEMKHLKEVKEVLELNERIKDNKDTKDIKTNKKNNEDKK